MSLYNAIFGADKNSEILIRILNLESGDAPIWPKNEQGEDWYPYDDGRIPAGEKYIKDCISQNYWPVGRFRNININKDGTKIILYTRNGGGNRESYFYVFDILKHHPNYITDYDDDFDSTYAYIEFSVPKEYQEEIRALSTGEEPKKIGEAFQELFKNMELKKNTEDVSRALNVGKKILEKIETTEKNTIISIDSEDGLNKEDKS